VNRAPQDIVTVIVGRGSASQTFKLPKDSLCYHSLVFASACNGPFIEGSSQTMSLDDIDGPVFGLLVAWLYTKDISDEDVSMGVVATSASVLVITALRLAKLWVLDRRFLIPNLQNQVITKLHPLLARLGGSGMKEVVDYVYSGEYDELRNLVSTSLAFMTREHHLSSILDQLPPQALVDVTRHLKCCFQAKETPAEMSLLTDMKMFFVEDGTASATSVNAGGSIGREKQPASTENAHKRQRLNPLSPILAGSTGVESDSDDEGTYDLGAWRLATALSMHSD